MFWNTEQAEIQSCWIRLSADINKHHQNQTRKSGQPVIIHPFRVANYICRAGLDAPTVVAALLHDIIEDTKITHKDIQKRYGMVRKYCQGAYQNKKLKDQKIER